MPQIYGVLSFPTGAKNSINPEDGATGALWDLITIYDATFLPMEDGLCITQWITPPPLQLTISFLPPGSPTPPLKSPAS